MSEQAQSEALRAALEAIADRLDECARNPSISAADAYDSFYRALVADALAHPAAAGQWQPIETAPHESEVLVWFGPSVGVKSATYTDPHGDGVMSWCVTDEKFDPHPIRRFCAPYPTHWIPLPPAPTKGEPA
jgi:hypothetical protein